jgi:plasmid maintenance system antidote protein VapI
MMMKKSNVDTDKSMEELLGGPMTFGMAVEALRQSVEISQVIFAKKLGVSKAYLCDIEKGRRPATIERAIRIAQVLGQPPQFFVKLALQSQLDEAGVKMQVELRAA